MRINFIYLTNNMKTVKKKAKMQNTTFKAKLQIYKTTSVD